MRLAIATTVCLAAILACGGGKPDDDDAETDSPPDDTDDTDDTDDSAAVDDTGPIELPASPLPFTLHLGGDAEGDAHFDTIECRNPPSDQLQLTFTGSTYSWSMRAFVREPFVGAGTYSTNVEVQLYENFSGGRYFSGTSAVITIEDAGPNGAWGSFTADPLDGDAGEATLSPQPIPIWCDDIPD